MKINNKKITVYELDFGDTNFITDGIQQILDWIETDMQNMDKDPLSYEITKKEMTQKAFDKLPEWS